MNAVETLIQGLHDRSINAAVLFTQPFMSGDVVDINGVEETIIHTELLGGEIKYATDESAWHRASDMKLVRKGTVQ